MKEKKKIKIIVVLGPTATGKTKLAVQLARKFNGEIISADSRQVYKGMDIGTGKVTKKEMRGIPHYLLDIVSPKKRFDVVQYKTLVERAIDKIFKKKKTPFLVGGTGFYIQSIVDGIVIPEVKPNWKLRKKLELQPLPELVKQLAKLDPVRAGTIDQNNPRRVVRALEIILATKRPVPSLGRNIPSFNTLQIGILKSQEELNKNIKTRLAKRLKNDAMTNEVKKLHKTLSWKRLEEFGLEYRAVAQYLQNKITKEEIVEKIQIESEQYVKRQMTWFKPNKKINWIKSPAEAEKLVKKFL